MARRHQDAIRPERHIERLYLSITSTRDASRAAGRWPASTIRVGRSPSRWTADNGDRLGVRTIPLLRETEVKPLMLIERAGKAVSRPLAEALPIDLKPGDQLVIDTVQFVLAYSILDIEAEDGSELELEYAPTYADTRLRSTDLKKTANQYEGLSTNQYIARAGRQTYMSGDSAGCKYPVIRLKSGKVRLHGVRMINRMYPFEVVGRFQSNDAMLNHLWQLGINTTCLCSEDAYVDSSTRERATWLGDGTVVEAPITPRGLGRTGQGRKALVCRSSPVAAESVASGELRFARRPRQGLRTLRWLRHARLHRRLFMPVDSGRFGPITTLQASLKRCVDCGRPLRAN